MPDMDRITIAGLEVFFRVGVPDEERAQPQRLELTIIFELDFAAAVAWEDVTETIDYQRVVEQIAKFGEEREWRLIEKLATDLAAMLLEEFLPVSVSVEVKKFILPQTRYVSVSVSRQGRGRTGGRGRR